MMVTRENRVIRLIVSQGTAAGKLRLIIVIRVPVPIFRTVLLGHSSGIVPKLAAIIIAFIT
jgi:hypothetical protein